MFDTDNAAYMKKAYKLGSKAALQSLLPNSLHLTCMAHIMNLTDGAFCRPFDQLNTFMLSFTDVLPKWVSQNKVSSVYDKKAATRKKGNAFLPPNPSATGWNSWFAAVPYHLGHFGLYKIEMEINVRYTHRANI